MAVSSVFAYCWMLPDEFKNFGQSLIATTLFSNNILLAITSGYWQLASEFKPLLHTWSLGVEEQYYVFFPLMLLLVWKFCRKHIALLFLIVAALSLAATCWWTFRTPDLAFYILPTRAWELLAGALASHHLAHGRQLMLSPRMQKLFGGLGLVLIVASIFLVRAEAPGQQILVIFPVLGAVLIVLFGSDEGLVGYVLCNRFMVGVGLISYSCYLWHQPFLAFARVYRTSRPGSGLLLLLILSTFALSYASWRWIETPFRNRRNFSRQAIFKMALAGSLAFILCGFYLEKSYGVISRIYDVKKAPIAFLDKRVYNQRVFQYKKDRFESASKLKLLVLGNSFGRDFVNMTTENFNTQHVEIVYRDDIQQCIEPFESNLSKGLYQSADVIVFNSIDPHSSCIFSNISYAESHHKELFYIGGKQFGYNLNWIIRLAPAERPNQFNTLDPGTLAYESESVAAIPAAHYISLLAPVIKGDSIPITDGKGFLLSTDRVHVTKFGAIYFGQRSLVPSRYGDIVRKTSQTAPAH